MTFRPVLAFVLVSALAGAAGCATGSPYAAALSVQVQPPSASERTFRVHVRNISDQPRCISRDVDRPTSNHHLEQLRRGGLSVDEADEGYLVPPLEGEHRLLPQEELSFDVLLAGFELDRSPPGPWTARFGVLSGQCGEFGWTNTQADWSGWMRIRRTDIY